MLKIYCMRCMEIMNILILWHNLLSATCLLAALINNFVIYQFIFRRKSMRKLLTKSPESIENKKKLAYRISITSSATPFLSVAPSLDQFIFNSDAF